jgi:two-component sensor histidine kinase
LPLNLDPDGAAARAAVAEAEANHRIANNLSMVAAYLRLQSAAVGHRPVSPEEVRRMLLEAAARVETIGKLHRHLASGPREGVVDLTTYLEELCSDLTGSMGFAGALSFRNGLPCRVGREKAVAVALSVLEATTNAMKYAHPAGIPGLIEVSCYPDLNGGVTVEVIDDGVGLPEGFDPSIDGGLGMKVLRSLVRPLGGRVAFDSDGLGLRVRISVPGEA